MARKRGAKAQLLGAYEATENTLHTGGYWKLPYTSLDYGVEQGLDPNDELGLGRDPKQPFYNLVRGGGNITVPLRSRSIGFWLKAAFGGSPYLTTQADTPASGYHTHTFVSGGEPLPISLEVGHPESTAAYFRFNGVKVNSIQFPIARTGGGVAVINLMGQTETDHTSSIDASPDTSLLGGPRIENRMGTATRGGSAIANLVSGQMTYANNLEAIETVRSDDLVEAYDADIASLTGDLTVRFADLTLYDDSVDEVSVALSQIYTYSANHKLTINAAEVLLPRAKRPIAGPGGIQASYQFIAFLESGSQLAQVILINDIADYDALA